jgi:hypothetical protein
MAAKLLVVQADVHLDLPESVDLKKVPCLGTMNFQGAANV